MYRNVYVRKDSFYNRFAMNVIKMIVAFCLLLVTQLSFADNLTGRSIDKSSGVEYYDLNKNGVMDIYEDSRVGIETRAEDLISKMTLQEKVGQMLTGLGWQMYVREGDSVHLSDEVATLVSDMPIGSLWGFMRADPWTRRTLKNGLNPRLASIASNMLQRYVIEHTRLGIPVFLAEECAHGHMAIGTTVFPTSIGQSSTWSPELVQRMGRAIAEEAASQGAHIAYGPVLDLARDPRWSRVEETYGEDTYLTTCFGCAMVKGLKEGEDGHALISTLKHFAAYGWPEGGHNGAGSNIGNRALEEYVLPPFREALWAGAGSVMSSYNEIDGTPCVSNSHLFKDVLRDRWGFEGFIVSDLRSIGRLREHGITHNNYESAVVAVNAGLENDLGMFVFGENLVKAVENSDVSESVIDSAVRHILLMKLASGLFDNPFTDCAGLPAQSIERHRQLALEMARKSIVLLKNDGILPLDRKQTHKYAVIGPNADNVYNMLGDYTAPQYPGSIMTVLDAVKAKAGANNVLYAKGCSIRDTSRAGILESVRIASAADVVILVVGGSSARDFSANFEETGAASVESPVQNDMDCGEGFDRSTLNLMGAQLALIEAIVKTDKPVVIVTIEGRPLLMEGAIQEASAIINAWYPGEEGGTAISDVLFGEYNPAGRLSVSIPRSVGQLPVYYNPKRASSRSNYLEEPGSPRYCFGYGLSYTHFSYSDMTVDVTDTEAGVSVSISVKITNDGTYDGEEVVQLYLRDECSSFTLPEKQLRGFQRIFIKQGDSCVVEFTLGEKDLALYDTSGRWVIEPGDFKVLVGGSCAGPFVTEDFELINRRTLIL